MNRLALLLFALGTLLSAMGTEGARTIYVDGAHGVDNSSCWDGGQTLPCRNLNLALLGMQQQNFTTIFIEKSNRSYELYPDSNATAFQWMTNLTIVGNDTLHSGIDPEVHINCMKEAGLTFLHSTNITLKNVVLSGCGALHNSTSFNSTGNAFLEFHVGLYFLFCKDVTFFQVTVNNSNGMGAVMYSTVGKNSIEHSTFSFNQVSSSENWGGGGLYIEFSYCSPGNLLCSDNQSDIPLEYASNAQYYIYSTSFHNNSANTTESTNSTFILPQKANHLAFGRGGGLSIFLKGNASNNVIIVTESNFTSNTAIWGAGLFIEHQDFSQNNRFEMSTSTLEGNQCYNSESPHQGTGGGGSRVGYIFFMGTHSRNNSMTFDTCCFSENQAYFGGGLSFYASREPTESAPTNALEFRNCTFRGNIARVGSAVDLSVWHPVTVGATVEPLFANCTFHNNVASYTHDLGALVGIGALYIDSISTRFAGHVTFTDNTHSALAGVSTGIHFENNSIAIFTNNSGRNGGAIALLGYAFIEVSAFTDISFINNSAEIRGGAIFAQSVGEHDLISSRNCFIRYQDILATPYNWTSRFYFKNNTAKGKNNSIYATSLLACLWGGAYGSTERKAKDVFCWTENWEYAGGYCVSEIATSPARFSQNNSEYHLFSIPGKRENLHVQMFDDRGTNATGLMVLTAHTLTPNTIHIDSNSQYIADDTIELHGEPDNIGKLALETADPRVIYTEVCVHMLSCPPGMIEDGQGNTATCKCGGNFGGLIECFGTEYQAKMQRGGWIGSHDSSGSKLLAGQCPYCSLFTDQQYFNLPPNTTNLSESLCGKIYRAGVLCGKCKEGYGPAVNSEDFICKDCSTTEAKYHWVYYILTEFFPITVFFVLVLLFNISATSAPTYAFVFFAQIVTTTFEIDGDGAILLKNVTEAAPILKDIYTIPYDIWNLNFFRPVLPKYCLSSDISTLQLLTLGYVTAAYPLFLIIVSYALVTLYEKGITPVVCVCRPIHHCFARFRGIWNLQTSIINAFATFLLLSYTKFTVVSLFLLTATPLLDDQGNTKIHVLYYDGTINYLSKEHIPYLIAAVLVLVTFVAIPPLVLVVPSIIRTLQKLFECQLCTVIQPSPKLQQFLNAFQGCFKDGTEGEGRKYDFRWFAGLYFILRFILFAVYALTSDWFLQYTLQQFVCMAAFLLFAMLRPYKEDFYNNLDALIFAILAGINTLTMYNLYLSFLSTGLSMWAFSLQYALIFFPLFYITAFLLLRFWTSYGLRIKRRFLWIRGKLRNQVLSDFEASAEEDFLTFTQRTGRLQGRRNHPNHSSALNNTDCENDPLLDCSDSFGRSPNHRDYASTHATSS